MLKLLHDAEDVKRNVFVRASCGSFDDRTQSVPNEITPQWQSDILYVVIDDNLPDKRLQLQLVLEEDGNEKILDEIEKPLDEICCNGTTLCEGNAFSLHNMEGTMKCDIEYISFVEASSDKPSPSPLLPNCLSVKLEYATDLPQRVMSADSGGVYVVVKVNKKTMKYQTKVKTKNPIWNETKHFVGEGLGEEILRCEVRLKQDETLIGWFELPLSEVADIRPVKRLAKQFILQDSQSVTDSYVRVLLQLKTFVRT